MQSQLYQEPFDRGVEKGASRMVIKVLTQKFGMLPSELRKKIESLDSETLDRIMDESPSYKDIQDVEKALR